MGKLTNLLQDTNEAYYWAGFLAADGSFSGAEGNRVRLTLSTKDELHLIKFTEYIGSNYQHGVNNTGHPYITTSKQCKNTVPLYKDKFDFKKQKTYNPPKSLEVEDDDLFLSFLIGFIDGDGCISKQSGGRKDSSIQIKCHESWRGFLGDMLRRVYKLSETNMKTKMNLTKDKKYCIMNLSNYKVIHMLKNKTVDLDLPVLKRKWDNIDLSFIPDRYDKSDESLLKIELLQEQGLSIKDIANEVGLTYSGVYMKLYRKRRYTDE